MKEKESRENVKTEFGALTKPDTVITTINFYSWERHFEGFLR